MNRMHTIIFFIILCMIVVITYLILYYKQKQEVLAITIAILSMIFVASGVIFVIPRASKAHLIKKKECAIEMIQDGNDIIVKCEDGKTYSVKTINTMTTSGYNAFANNKKHKNVKLELTYRYDYKIWGVIPAYSTSHVVNIYMDNEWFEHTYGCELDQEETRQ